MLKFYGNEKIGNTTVSFYWKRKSVEEYGEMVKKDLLIFVFFAKSGDEHTIADAICEHWKIDEDDTWMEGVGHPGGDPEFFLYVEATGHLAPFADMDDYVLWRELEDMSQPKFFKMCHECRNLAFLQRCEKIMATQWDHEVRKDPFLQRNAPETQELAVIRSVIRRKSK